MTKNKLDQDEINAIAGKIGSSLFVILMDIIEKGIRSDKNYSETTIPELVAILMIALSTVVSVSFQTLDTAFNRTTGGNLDLEKIRETVVAMINEQFENQKMI